MNDKKYWEKRFWQLFRMVSLERREAFVEMIGSEEE